MLKIMHCISDTNFGGAGRVLLNYLQHFDREAFEVTVVLPKGSKLLDYLKSPDYSVVQFDGLYDRSYNKEDIKGLVTLIKELQPDIVHSHGALSARIAAKKCRKKAVYTRHSVFDLPKWQTVAPGKWILGGINHRYADRIIAVSPAAKTLLTDSGTKSEIIDVVFNGVERIEMVPDTQKGEFCKRFGVSDTDFVCTILARLEAVKGHAYVIEAAKLLKNEGITDIKILIAGTGGIEQQLKHLAKSNDVEDIVLFVGFVKDIPALLAVTDVQLNASYGTEATSMALLEGFSIGIPAIVSDFGGNPFVVNDGENGLIFPKKNAAALARAIKTVKNNKDLYQKISSGALSAFEDRFTAAKMTENTEKIYYQLLGVANND